MPYADPIAQRKAKAESARRQRRKKPAKRTVTVEPSEPSALLLPEGSTLRTYSDGLAVLERAMHLVDGDLTGHGLAKARTAAFIVSTLWRGLDTADVDARLTALELRYGSIPT